MYRATTRNVQITVTPEYISERSSPKDGEYFWAYTIEIKNLGRMPVQLVSRGTGKSPTATESSKKSGALASSASSRCSGPASVSNIPAACRYRRRPV